MKDSKKIFRLIFKCLYFSYLLQLHYKSVFELFLLRSEKIVLFFRFSTSPAPAGSILITSSSLNVCFSVDRRVSKIFSIKSDSNHNEVHHFDFNKLVIELCEFCSNINFVCNNMICIIVFVKTSITELTTEQNFSSFSVKFCLLNFRFFMVFFIPFNSIRFFSFKKFFFGFNNSSF